MVSLAKALLLLALLGAALYLGTVVFIVVACMFVFDYVLRKVDSKW